MVLQSNILFPLLLIRRCVTIETGPHLDFLAIQVDVHGAAHAVEVSIRERKSHSTHQSTHRRSVVQLEHQRLVSDFLRFQILEDHGAIDDWLRAILEDGGLERVSCLGLGSQVEEEHKVLVTLGRKIAGSLEVDRERERGDVVVEKEIDFRGPLVVVWACVEGRGRRGSAGCTASRQSQWLMSNDCFACNCNLFFMRKS